MSGNWGKKKKETFKNKIRPYSWSGKANVLEIPRSKLGMNANCSCRVTFPNSVLPERCDLLLPGSRARCAWSTERVPGCFSCALKGQRERAGTAAGVTALSPTAAAREPALIATFWCVKALGNLRQVIPKSGTTGSPLSLQLDPLCHPQCL